MNTIKKIAIIVIIAVAGAFAKMPTAEAGGNSEDSSKGDLLTVNTYNDIYTDSQLSSWTRTA